MSEVKKPGERPDALPEAGGASERGQVRIVLEAPEDRVIREPTILDGGEAETLEAGIHTFTTRDDITGAAATSLAGYKYSKRGNEDRIYVHPKAGHVAVIDGMGGGGNGALAAQLVAQAIQDGSGNMERTGKNASILLNNKENITNEDGACFLHVVITPGQPIEVGKCGDVELHHFDKDGRVKYRPSQHLELTDPPQPQSVFEEIELLALSGLSDDELYTKIKEATGLDYDPDIDLIVQRIRTSNRPFVESTHPDFVFLRSRVLHPIMQDSAKVLEFQTPESAQSGDVILVISDGISDNFSQDEIQAFVKQAIDESWTPERLIEEVSLKLDKRFTMKQDNPGLPYDLDNASLIAMRVQ